MATPWKTDTLALALATLASGTVLRVVDDPGGTPTSKKTTIGDINSFVLAFILASGATFPNLGLHILDTDSSHDLIIAAGSNLTADRTLSLLTGDNNRSLDISAANVVISTAGAALIDDADAATQRTTLGLGTIATQNANNVTLTGGSITGITDLAVADGGTGASTASNARTNLGVAIGSNVQAWATALDSLSSASANGISLVTAANYAAMRTLLGLVVGTDVQAFDSDLSSWAGVTRAAGFDTFAATPSSANLRSLLTDETGSSGGLVFAGSPSLTTPTIAGSTFTGVNDAGGASSFEIPNSATPTVDADGEIAVDTSVTDFSHGILKYYSGEELGVLAMPIAQFTTPSNGAVPTYNSTADEFQMVVPAGGGDVIGPASSVDGQPATFSGTGGKTLQYTTLLTGVCEGRLTLTTATPVTVSDVTAASTIYFTPYKGNRIALYDGSAKWNIRSFSEISLALSGLTSGVNYDVFVYDNAGTPTIDTLVAWTNDTTRATALVLQDGVWVKTGATTRRYVGTIRTTSTTTTEDSAAKRLVWNMYNRVQKHLHVTDTTDNWTYSTGAFRYANNSAANRVEVLKGLNEDAVTVAAVGRAYNSTSSFRDAITAIGLDSSSARSSLSINSGGRVSDTVQATLLAQFSGAVGLGWHYLAWLEYGAGSDTQTWLGDSGGSLIQTGLNGRTSA